MATNAGFSAQEEIFGTITGLTAEDSQPGVSGSVAESPNEWGDTIAHDEYGVVMSPTVKYAVVGNITSLPALGTVVSYNSKKIMVGEITVTTAVNTPPSVEISGKQVNDSATTGRTYAVALSLSPLAKTQDVATAFAAATAPAAFQNITAKWSADIITKSIGGTIVSSLGTHGKLEVTGTINDPAGNQTIAAATGFTVTSPDTKTSPNEAYVTHTATVTKWLTGASEASD